MPRRLQDFGQFEQQFHNIVETSLDKTVFIDVTTPGADAEFSVDHGLGTEPVGYLVIGMNKAGIVYNGTTIWTTSLIYLRCSVATAIVRLMIF